MFVSIQTLEEGLEGFTHGWERSGRTTGSEDGKAQYEDHYLCPTIQSPTENVNVFPEPTRVVAPQPELTDDSHDNGGRDD
jgi:hypothetical protein